MRDAAQRRPKKFIKIKIRAVKEIQPSSIRRVQRLHQFDGRAQRKKSLMREDNPNPKITIGQLIQWNV